MRGIVPYRAVYTLLVIVLITTAVLSVLPCNASPTKQFTSDSIVWIRFFIIDKAGFSRGYSLVPLTDGSAVFVGEIGGGTYRKLHGSDAIIAKVSPLGGIEWFKVFGLNKSYESFLDVTYGEGGAIYVVGKVLGPRPFDWYGDVLVVKVGSDGELIWGKAINLGGIDSAYVVRVLKNELIFISGFAGKAPSMRFLALMKPSGELVSVEGINLTGKNKEFKIADIEPTPDNAVVIAGVVKEKLGGLRARSKVFLIKVDLKGKVLWAKAINASVGLTEEVNDVVVAPDGSIYVVGAVEGWLKEEAKYALKSYNGAVLKFTPNGEFKWMLVLGMPPTKELWKGFWNDRIVKASIASNGDVLVAGESIAFKAEKEACFVARVSPNGKLRWVRVLFRIESKKAPIPAITDVKEGSKGDVLFTGFNLNRAFIARVHGKFLIGEVGWFKYEELPPEMIYDGLKNGFKYVLINNLRTEDYRDFTLKLINMLKHAGVVDIPRNILIDCRTSTYIGYAEDAIREFKVIIKCNELEPKLREGTFKVLIANTSGIVANLTFKSEVNASMASESVKLRAGRYVVAIYFRPTRGYGDEFWGFTIVYHFLRDTTLVYSKSTPSIKVKKIIMPEYAYVIVAFDILKKAPNNSRVTSMVYKSVTIDRVTKKVVASTRAEMVRAPPYMVMQNIRWTPLAKGGKFRLIVLLSASFEIHEKTFNKYFGRPGYLVHQYVIDFEVPKKTSTTKTTTKTLTVTTTKVHTTTTTSVIKTSTTKTKAKPVSTPSSSTVVSTSVATSRTTVTTTTATTKVAKALVPAEAVIAAVIIIVALIIMGFRLRRR